MSDEARRNVPGRTVVITGASSGIGAVAAQRLAEKGFRTAVVGRDLARTRAVAEQVGGEAFTADFERLDDVRALAAALLDRFETIDIVANNAGGLYGERAVTVDGHERTLQANYLAPLLLTSLLRERLVATAAVRAAERAGDPPGVVPTADVRVINTASMANLFGSLRLDDLGWQQRPWRGGWRAYGTSKLAVILGTRVLAEKLVGTGVTAYSFHPGTIVTRFGGQSPLVRAGLTLTGGHYGRTPEAGAGPLLALADLSRRPAASGTYFDRFIANGRVNKQGRDPLIAHEVWAAGLDAVGAVEVWRS